MKQEKLVLPNLTMCIILDAIGMASFLFPVLGDFSDVVWAPISALIFNAMFGGRLGVIGGVLNFLEEVFPFTDFIPSFTIAWHLRKYAIDKNARVLA